MKTLNQKQLREITISFFEAPISNIKSSEEFTLLEIHQMISDAGFFEDITSKIRNKIVDKKEVCHSCTPSGVFTIRNDNSLVKPSGLICLDLDKLGADFEKIKSKLYSLTDHLVMCFVSPSGDGLKAFFIIDETEASYKEWYMALRTYISSVCDIDINNIDSKCSNISRACFLCFDPDAFLNTSDSISSIDISKYLTSAINTPKTTKSINKLEFEDYQYNLDFTFKDSEMNFMRFIHDTEKSEGAYGVAREPWIHKLASRCNTFGMSKDKCLNYTLKHFESHHESVRSHDPIELKSHIINPINDVYKRYGHQFDSFQKKAVVVNDDDDFVDCGEMRTANQRLIDGLNQPETLSLFGEFWQTGEIAIFFGDTGRGKSALAVIIADSISKGEMCLKLKNNTPPQKVLFYDFELSDRQYTDRYTSKNGLAPYSFSDNLIIDNMDMVSLIKNNSKLEISEIVYKKIKKDIVKHGAQVVFVDNITFLSGGLTHKGDVARDIMLKLIDLKIQYKVSILVLAHTPKVQSECITINHLAGSKQFANLADCVFTMGQSVNDIHIKYLKQVKASRSAEFKYDSSNVLVCEMEKIDPVLTFTHNGFSKEYLHLSTKEQNKETLRTEIVKLKDQGKSFREIAEIVGISKSQVEREYKIAISDSTPT